MTEQEHIELLRAEIAREVRDEALFDALSAAAVAEHPDSAVLWCRRGDAISLMHDPHAEGPPSEALACYRHAAELAPSFAEAWEEIGHYLDTHLDAFEEAEAAFRKAIVLGAPASARIGLARVLAQRSERDAALDSLNGAESANGERDEIEAMRQGIKDGVWGAPKRC